MTDKNVNFEQLENDLSQDKDWKGEPYIQKIGASPEDIALSHNKIMEIDVKEREQVLSPILTKGGIVLLHAVAGAGKSHFSLNCAYAIALGGRFLKYEAPIPQKVLYIDGELGHEDVHRYVKPIEKAQGALVFPENMTYLCKDRCPNSIIPKLSDPQGRKWYRDYIIRGGFNVVFWDNLRMLSNIDENKTSDWAPIEELFLFFRDNNIATWLIHHAGSDGSKQRGVSARMDAVNTVISLQKMIEEENNGKIQVIYQKGRHLSPEESVTFEAQNHFDGRWSFKNIEVSFDEQVWQMIQLKWKDQEIMNEFKCSRMRVYRAKKRLEAKGFMF